MEYGTRSAPHVQPVVVRANDAHRVIGCGRTHFGELAKTDGFPRPIVLGDMHKARARGYIIAELVDWATRRAARA